MVCLGSDKYYIMYDILVCVTFYLIIIFLDEPRKKNIRLILLILKFKTIHTILIK